MLYQITKIILVPFSMFLIKDIKGLDKVPKKGAFILASNHSSYLDPIIIPVIFVKYFKRKVHYLGKKELFKTWVGKKIHNTLGTIPIDRGGGDNALEKAIDTLKAGKIMGIFPEGGRTRTGKLNKGKTGVARLALWAKVPVVPIGIKGSYEIWPVHQKIFKFKKRIYINIGKPIYFSKYYNKKITKRLLREATTIVMKQIANLLKQKP